MVRVINGLSKSSSFRTEDVFCPKSRYLREKGFGIDGCCKMHCVIVLTVTKELNHESLRPR